MYMATPLNLFAYLFAIVGIIAIIAVIYYTYLYYSRKHKQDSVNRWPPRNFMKYIGARCPTGWKYQGRVEGQDSPTGLPMDKCYNMYDVKVADPEDPACYHGDAESSRTQYFTELANWPLRKSERQHMLRDRCKFVKKCGPKKGMFATWFGISELC